MSSAFHPTTFQFIQPNGEDISEFHLKIVHDVSGVQINGATIAADDPGLAIDGDVRSGDLGTYGLGHIQVGLNIPVRLTVQSYTEEETPSAVASSPTFEFVQETAPDTPVEVTVDD